jgi:O-methyltransferase involved in polyketide biosynthesis
MDAQVDRERPVIITAQGLLPYFEQDEVRRMLIAWARLFPGAWLLFDASSGPIRVACLPWAVESRHRHEGCYCHEYRDLV